MFVFENLKTGLKIGWVHVPRTGGTSFKHMILDHISNDPNWCHRKQGKGSHPRYWEFEKHDITFTTIRNPWDRTFSDYCFFKKNYEVTSSFDMIPKHGEFGLGMIVVPPRLIDGKYPDFNTWMLNFRNYKIKSLHDPNRIYPYSPSTTQSDFLSGKHQPEYLVRFERLQQDSKKVLRLFGCTDDLPKLNATVHDHYSKYYNQDSIDIVNTVFKEDIDRWEYKFEYAGEL